MVQVKSLSSLKRSMRYFACGLAVFLSNASVNISAARNDKAAVVAPSKVVVGIRRLTEDQYRNAIADIFGPDIEVTGRFEPIVRPAHQMVATAATNAAISPSGFEQFDNMARLIAGQVFDEKHRETFVDCTPRDVKQSDDACARATLAPLGRLLFRRALTKPELERYVTIAREGTKISGGFYDSLQLSLASMLVSPDFLYIVETAEPDPANRGALRLDSYARAARLSFVLWNTTPNEALLRAAEAGKLTDEANLRAIADKMVASPRLADGVKSFFADMLVYEKFEDLKKDPIIYPRFNIAVSRALAEQMQRTIIDVVLTRDLDYRELFTSRHTVMTRALGPLYNARLDASTGWQPYEFPDDGKRAGLLSQAGLVALYSHPGRSSATLRGRAVRELLMCQPVPDPPGNVDFKVVQDTTNAVLRTARERLAEHAANPVCAGCHSITDPIGLTLESFDGSGDFRSHENGAAIDTSGVMDRKKLSGPVGLGKALGDNPATTQCVTQRAIEYATGRQAKEADVEKLYNDFSAGGYRIRSLFRDVVTSPDFYRVAAPAPAGKAGRVAVLTSQAAARA
jgi:hypothetical protein